MYATLASMIADGTLSFTVKALYPIEEIRAAVARAGRAERSGKILVRINGR